MTDTSSVVGVNAGRTRLTRSRNRRTASDARDASNPASAPTDSKGGHRVLLLARDAESRPGGREHAKPWRRSQQTVDHDPGVRDLFEVVEDDEHLAFSDPIEEDIVDGATRILRQVQSGADGRRHLVGGADVRKRDEPRPVRISIGDLGCRPDRQPGLPASAGTREGHEAMLSHEVRDARYRVLAADEGRGFSWQVRTPDIKRAERWESRGKPADLQLP